MNEKDIVTAAMKSCGWTQEELASRAGYKTQSAISNRLNGKSMRVDTFVKLLTTMGYEVIVKSTSPNTNKNKWVISTDKLNAVETRNQNNNPIADENTTPKIDLNALLSIDDEPAPPQKKTGRIKLT